MSHYLHNGGLMMKLLEEKILHDGIIKSGNVLKLTVF